MRRPLGFMAAALALAWVAGACGDDDEDERAEAPAQPTGPTVRIASPAEGATVRGNVVSLDLVSSGIAITKADGDRSGRTGHYHVFVDREPVAPGQTIEKAADVVHSTDDPLRITGLLPGPHRFTVVLGDGAHARIGTAQDSVQLDVAGPGVDAVAPASVAANQGFALDVRVEGVELAKADGDRSGRTGHVHVFVDRDPTPAGQPIPAGDPAVIHSATVPVAIPALTPGEHTLFVVLGDGAHFPFDPPVTDKLAITVT